MSESLRQGGWEPVPDGRMIEARRLSLAGVRDQSARPDLVGMSELGRLGGPGDRDPATGHQEVRGWVQVR